MNTLPEDITVLGGGPAGLCVGYHAKKAGINFIILEATAAVGGNAKTFRVKDFQYDSGAHRWHDKYPEITKELGELMGCDLKQIHVPSHIFHHQINCRLAALCGVATWQMLKVFAAKFK